MTVIKCIFSVSVWAFLLAGSATLASGPDKSGMEAACLRTAAKYFIALDNADMDSFVSAFTQDASLDLAGTKLKGHREMRDYFKARPENRVLFHHMTSALIEPLSDTTAKGTIYALFNGSVTDGGKVANQYLVTAIYYDDYQIKNGECKITNRRMAPKLINPIEPYNPTQ